MQGTYDLGLVALSYLIASLAGFVAIAFAARMRARSDSRVPWLAGGALAMGTGIWSMHFIGMLAFTLPVPMSYDAGITILSWLAAVGVSALALYIVGYGKLRSWTLAVGALVMGAGVCLMHYSGMAAMRMDPGITYNPELFAASVAIAVVASAVALITISKLREVRSWRDVSMRIFAALVLGFAVAGMHYTGMSAAEFTKGALCAEGNPLSADVMPWPISIGSLLILGFGILLTVLDARDVKTARKTARELEVRVHDLAFIDRETGLPNRARLNQQIAERIRDRVADPFALITFRLESHDGSPTNGRIMKSLHSRLSRLLPDAILARTQTDHLVVMVDGDAQSVEQRTSSLIENVRQELSQERFSLMTKSAQYPEDGDNSHWLLLRSAPKSETI
jgi:NO-binding membrane sensor protein with MHYT domain/GGDEF domain-containing protein